MATFCAFLGSAALLTLGVAAIPAAVAAAHEAPRRWALPAALWLYVAGWLSFCVGGVAMAELVGAWWGAIR